MGKRLMFDDIDEWTPSSISIVDEPFHPLCHFEVYEDDDEYVKKSIEVNDGEIMANEQPVKEEEQMVSGPVSFFKDLLNRNVGKSDEVPPAQNEESENGEILKLLRSFDERLKKLEEQQKPTEPVKDAVVKSEGETEGETSEETEETNSSEETEETEEEVVDEEEVVTKSIDLDLATGMSQPEESFCKRMGRNENGMTW